MPLSNEQKFEISNLLREKIEEKLGNYDPETDHMPFHIRLLGKERMALYSFIHSICTSLGQSVFEQIASITAKPNFQSVKHQYKEFNDTISRDAQKAIQELIDSLTLSRIEADKEKETQIILDISQSGNMTTVKRPIIDLFIKSFDNIEYYIDMKTVKPNTGDFVRFKRTLLEWVAIRGALDNTVKIRTMLAFPYNPYEPMPYERWTMKGLFDLQKEFFVGKGFWDFLGGEKTYEDILDIFQEIGIELRQEIEKRFKQF